MQGAQHVAQRLSGNRHDLSDGGLRPGLRTTVATPRHGDAKQAIQRRLAIARKELAAAGFYRHRVVNDHLDRAVDEIAQILIARENELNAG